MINQYIVFAHIQRVHLFSPGAYRAEAVSSLGHPFSRSVELSLPRVVGKSLECAPRVDRPSRGVASIAGVFAS